MAAYRCELCKGFTDQPAAHRMVHELTDSPWSYLRSLQWERPSAGGAILVMPECFRPGAVV